MSGSGPLITLSPHDWDAVLFDMDGVLTRTADLHAHAWKKLFDELLHQHADRTRTPFVPFDIELDYRRYVDGKSRNDGINSFLTSRGISLPLDAPADEPDTPSLRALGESKDRFFLEELRNRGVAPYEASIELVHALRAQEIRTGVVTSSTNGARVLEAAGIDYLFDTRVDGNDILKLDLRGKPSPDAFLEAARRLAVQVERVVVIEDAIAGVEAGRAGKFGLVIGVDRTGHSQALRAAGAHEVVTHLAQVKVTADSPSAWSLLYDDFDAAREGTREALCALGNGYVTVRGAVPWASADGLHYPGTYLAGGYNRLHTDVAGRPVEHEDLVNFPNALALSFRIAKGNWFDFNNVRLLSYRQELDLRRGVLLRTLRFDDSEGHRCTLAERRFVSMSDMHLYALELSLTAENWSESITVRSAIDGRVTNAGAKLYRHFNNKHLIGLGSAPLDTESIYLRVCTSQSDIRLVQAARTKAFHNGAPLHPKRRLIKEPAYIAHEFDIALTAGNTVSLEKTIALFTSRDQAISEPTLAARNAIARAPRFEPLLTAHIEAWAHLWRRFDIHLKPRHGSFRLNMPMLLRLNMLHLLQAVSPHSIGLDIGVPARGWTGEAYQGHIFWDELFIFPFLNFRTPEITRSLLMYRFRRLGEARIAAKAAGFRGAMFPWQSGSDGQEQTQELNFNPLSQRWIPDNSFRQRHVGSAIVYNVWQYYQVTHDMEFLMSYGAEVVLSVALFWSSLATFNPERERYEIRGVMGPDEYHERYPNAERYGLDNNAYTNIMAVWVLRRALDILDILSSVRRAEIMRTLGLDATELQRWKEISRSMFVPFDDGLISQFEGYEHLTEFDWERYRTRYGNIQRLDLILEAENDSPDRYKLSKQADVLMLFYLFSAEELRELLTSLGYSLQPQMIPCNVTYYDARSSHGSTLSRVVHAWVLARSDRSRAGIYFAEALQSDVSDIQQGTTAEGIHLGAMAGTVDLLERVATGIEVTGDSLRFHPRLPEEIARMDLRIRYRGHSLDLHLTHDSLVVRGRERGVAPIRLAIGNDVHDFAGGSTRIFRLR
jgi:beta-phosphoglucomutase family hydrolase